MILQFPRRNRGRIRKSQSLEAMGFVSMMTLEQHGKAIPQNVQRLDEPYGASLPCKTPELLFATIIWSVLSQEQKDRVMTTVRGMAYGAARRDECALQLYNMLNRRS